MIIKIFIAGVIKWAASINWSQFLKILPIIRDAAILYPKAKGISKEENAHINGQRAAWASSMIVSTLSLGDGWQANLLRELALAWLNHISKK